MSDSPIPAPPVLDYWEADPALAALLKEALPDSAWQRASRELAAMGRRAGMEAPPLAARADRLGPRLVTHDARGQRIDVVEYHPDYRRLEEIAYGGGCVAIKYEPGDVLPFRHRVRFRPDLSLLPGGGRRHLPRLHDRRRGARARKVRHREPEERFIPRLASRDMSRLMRGAMFLTEKHGGSDVGATATVARASGSTYLLEGEKWFCSNVDAELILTLARPEGAPAGTKGLGLFLLERELPTGARNSYRIERLKDKLGVRSMPTGEVTLLGAEAELVGEPGRGFHMMAEMLNLSRLYNATCSIASLRRASRLGRSSPSGSRSESPSSSARSRAAPPPSRRSRPSPSVTGSSSRAIELLDLADAGDVRAAELVRILTPLVKYTTAKAAVAGVSECLELHGGRVHRGVGDAAPPARRPGAADLGGHDEHPRARHLPRAAPPWRPRCHPGSRP
ncbi:MAG: acyl-CoA dehydrogenase family protein [Acidobacteriota bacterium]